MALITLRRAEVAAVAAILEQEYETPDAMARAVLTTAYDHWRERDWWVALHHIGTGSPVAYGLEATEAAARKFAETLGLGWAQLMHIASTDEFSARVEETELEAELKYGDGPCKNCGHRKWLHGAIGFKGKSVRVPAHKACHLNCRCKEYVLPDTKGKQRERF